MIDLFPGTYEEFVVTSNNQKILYVEMNKALYGMLRSSALYYKKFRADIESIGFKVNPYDLCVANRMVNGCQHTVTWHVDDVKSSHVDPKVNDEFGAWCEMMYDDDELGHVKIVRGTKHDYLAMELDYSTPGSLKIDMQKYIEKLINEFPYPLTASSKPPWTEKLLKVDITAESLDDSKRELFHTYVIKLMFLCKRARPDIELAIGFLSSRVTAPNEGDWNKLIRVLNFLKGTYDDVLTLAADESNTLTWYIDAAFAVHHDMRSHTGAVLTLGKGAIYSSSTKQKTNSRSSTEAELNGLDDTITKALWTKRFLDWQDFPVTVKIQQDNQSTIKTSEQWKSQLRTSYQTF